MSDREVETSEGRFVMSRIVVETSPRGESPLTFNWCFMARSFTEPMNGEKQMNPDLELVAFWGKKHKVLDRDVHLQTICQSAMKKNC